MPWGEKRLGTKEQIFIPIAVTFTIFLINLFLSALSYEKMPLISRIFSVTTFMAALFTLIFIVRTTQLIL